MRLLMLGTGPFAVPTLERLANSPHDVATVITRPPRGRRPQAPPMQQAAQRLELPVWQPETLNADEARTRLGELQPELLVVCDYGEILKDATLAVATRGGVNLHASLLPRYRGAAPVQWALLRGETETGNSVIEMTAGLDAGPCLGVQRVAIDRDENAEQLEARLAILGAELVLEVIDRLTTGTCPRADQDPTQTSRAPRLRKEHGEIDWNRSAAEIHNQVRGLQPWPRAATQWLRSSGEPLRLLIHRTAAVEGEFASSVEGGVPGTVLAAGPRWVVQTGDGALELVEVQPAGKRAMAAAEFLRGAGLAAGDVLGDVS